MNLKKSYPSLGIWVVICLYIISLITMLILVPNYIEKKDNRLHYEMVESVRNAFNGRDSYIDISYANQPVKYEKGNIPTKPSSNYPELLNNWKEDYGNLYKMYDINWRGNSDKPWEHEDGWNLMEIHYDYDGVYANWYFPYAVGYIKQDYSWGYDYAPSVTTAVGEAFEFFTSNPKSNFYDNFERGSIDRIFSNIESNEYYFLDRDSIPRMWHSGVPIIPETNGLYDRPKVPVKATYMYNGYYKVFIANTQYRTWTIRKWAWKPDEYEKEKLYKKWSLGLTVGAVLLLIPFISIKIKRNKKKNETLKNKLIRLCNPSNFVKNFDKEKIDNANDIYQKIISSQLQDDNLYEIADEAVAKLGITLIDTMEIEEIKEKLNPKNFMNPYNSEKIARANELMERLLNSGLRYAEFLVIKKNTEELYS